MPRVHHVMKARKAQPHAGIEAGDEYYWWKFRYGGKRVSKTYPRRSALTQSQYYAAQYDAEDYAQEALCDLAGEIRSGALDDEMTSLEERISDAVAPIVQAGEENADTLEENADNVESGFGHETYQSEAMKERAEEYRAWASEAEDWSAQISPEDKPNRADYPGSEEYDGALDEWRENIASEVENIDTFYQGS